MVENVSTTTESEFWRTPILLKKAGRAPLSLEELGWIAKEIGAKFDLATDVMSDDLFAGVIANLDFSEFGIRDLTDTLFFFSHNTSTPTQIFQSLENANNIKRALNTRGVAFLVELDERGYDFPEFRKKNGMVRLSKADLLDLLECENPTKVLLAATRTQLPYTLPCPFNTTAVASGFMFAGRNKEFRRILANEEHQYVITGGRRIGKSSLLERCYWEAKNQTPFPADIHVSNGLTWGTTHENIGNILRIIAPNSAEIAKWESYRNRSLQSVAEKIVKETQRTQFLFIDELDRVVDEDEASQWKLFRFLRHLCDAKALRIVAAGYRSMRKLVRGGRSPFYQKATPITLQPLKLKDTLRLVDQPFSLYGISIENREGFVAELHSKSGGFPFMTQLIGEKLFNKSISMATPSVGIDDVREVLESHEFRTKVMQHVLDNTRSGDKPARVERLFCCLLAAQQAGHNEPVSWNKQDFFIAAKRLGFHIKQIELDSALEEMVHSAVFRFVSGGRYSFAFPLLAEKLREDYPNPEWMREALLEGAE